MILDEILAVKALEVERLKESFPLRELRQRAADAPPARDFEAALRQDGISLIAEVKRASPSRGVIRRDWDPPALARAYAGAGARAISVLTDATFFKGSAEDLRRVREAVSLPVLRKEFIIDPAQLYESRLLGADAVLLIVAALEQSRLKDLLALARELGMSALVEVHTAGELEIAGEAGAQIIGINNRDLNTFRTSLKTTLRLLPLVPRGRLKVSESGIRTPAEVARLAEEGVDAVLVGETLMRAPEVGAAVRRLLGGVNGGQG